MPFSIADGGPFGGSCQIHGPVPSAIPPSQSEDMPTDGDGVADVKSPVLLRNPAYSHSKCPPEVHKSCFCVRFIAEHTKMLEDSTKVRNLYYYITKEIRVELFTAFKSGLVNFS